MGLFRDSCLGWNKFLLPGVQSTWHQKNEPVAVALCRRKHQAPLILLSLQMQEEGALLSPEVLWCFSIYEVTTSKDQWSKQGKWMQEQNPLSTGLYIYSFQTSHFLSSIHSSESLHALSPESFKKNIMCLFSAKQPFISLFPEEYPTTHPSLQQNQKFPLHVLHFTHSSACSFFFTHSSV